jgi:RpiB/LacA/LacB family sugar-phosphate isomerase
VRIAVGADHAGYEMKEVLAAELRAAGHEVLDFGTHGTESVDYPDFGEPVAEAVRNGDAERGVLVCGSAIGMCLVANKVPGVRAGVTHDSYSAHQGVEHDDMNVICLGSRVIGLELAREVVSRFLEARFSGQERHRRRVDKLLAIESKYMAEDDE